MKPIKFHPLKIIVPPKNVKFYADSHSTTLEATGRNSEGKEEPFPGVRVCSLDTQTLTHHEMGQMTTVSDQTSTIRSVSACYRSQFISRAQRASKKLEQYRKTYNFLKTEGASSRAVAYACALAWGIQQKNLINSFQYGAPHQGVEWSIPCYTATFNWL